MKEFRFKQFTIVQDDDVMPVGTDGILLGAWSHATNPQRILDIGTGSGLLALMLAQKYPDAILTAIDIDKNSCEVATENVASSQWSARIDVVHCGVRDYDVPPFDLIVCNPPFFNRPDLYQSSHRQKSRNAVFLPHSDLLQGLNRLLLPSGSACLILPWLEGSRFIELCKHYGLFAQRICEVVGKEGDAVKRLLIKVGKQSSTTSVEHLVLRGEDGQYSATYSALTEAYYASPLSMVDDLSASKKKGN